MLMAALHGLLMRKPPTPPEQSYNRLVTDAHLTPLGKSSGSYVIDTLSTIAVLTTKNLPDVTGYLKNTHVEFLLERYSTPNGDFIVAEARPTFPSNLGQPIIDGQYLQALKSRKFITYHIDGVWTAWREINSGSQMTGSFNADPSLELHIDPVTIRDYFVVIAPAGNLTVVLGAATKFIKPVSLTIAPESNTYTVSWPNGVIWTNETQTPPSTVNVGSRLQVTFFQDPNNTSQLLADAQSYKVS